MQERITHPSAELNRNYPLFIAEGGLLMGATYFTNHQTLLPSLILEQNGPQWLAALAPSLFIFGMFATPIFTHRLVDRLSHFHPFSNVWMFLQRFVFLLGALCLFQFASTPLAVVLILALTPLVSGIFGGIPLAAWQQLFMNTIPENRRPSNMALRFLVAGIIGMGAGKVIEHTLAAHPGSLGYARLHLWAGVVALLGWLAFAFVKEGNVSATLIQSEPQESGAEEESPGWYSLFRTPQLARFWIALILMHTVLIIIPFYAIGIRERFQQDIGFLGVLAVWQMAGFTLGNLSAGFFGDKLSGKWVFQTGVLLMAFSLIPGVFTHNLLAAKFAYFAFGFSLIFTIVGKDSFILEIAPFKGRSLFLSLASLLSMLSMFVFSMVSYFIWSQHQRLDLIAIPVFVGLPLAFWVVRKDP